MNKNKKKKKQTIHYKPNNLKIALCTLGREENLYAKEYVNHYLNLGVDHIFIYDDNGPNTEKFSDVIDQTYKNNVTIYKNNTIKGQSTAFTDCYKKIN